MGHPHGIAVRASLTKNELKSLGDVVLDVGQKTLHPVCSFQFIDLRGEGCCWRGSATDQRRTMAYLTDSSKSPCAFYPESPPQSSCEHVSGSAQACIMLSISFKYI